MSTPSSVHEGAETPTSTAASKVPVGFWDASKVVQVTAIDDDPGVMGPKQAPRPTAIAAVPVTAATRRNRRRLGDLDLGCSDVLTCVSANSALMCIRWNLSSEG